jgi:hypothetical protein
MATALLAFVTIGTILLGLTYATRAGASDGRGARSSVPAREMTQRQALDTLVSMGAAGLATITPTHTDASGLADRVTLGTRVAGVDFRYAGKLSSVHDIDPRFAVLLVRLADMLRDRFGVVAIDHLGIFPGAGPPNDVHNRGLAIDFAGAETMAGEKFSVLKDWGQRPSKGSGLFRLEPTDRGAELFSAVYDLATHEATDHIPETGVPSSIGQGSYILTPDHPTKKLAEDHRDHMHLQIGPTYA